ncbi:putative nuclease HARBI1, partial [Anopheles moucheti]|uniref:putative nuclease HARBI1 n=1 Tax=Anopheles moucheti TaxID=186751 RepID=UPI0022F044FC
FFLENDENDEKNLASHRRRLRKQLNPLELSDKAFIQNFRIPKLLFEEILGKISPYISPKHNRGLTATEKLATTLRFLAQGSYQLGVGNDYNIAIGQSTFCETLDQTLAVLERELAYVINMDLTEHEKSDARRYFYSKLPVPGVEMCIDGTHVRIVAPRENPIQYFNRKGFYSLNALMICDHRKMIRFVDARFSGSDHDSYIFNNSPIYTYLEQKWRSGDRMFKILGDSAYPSKPWLIKPHRNADPNSSEALFNEQHAKARAIVERTFGMLKGRFRCINGERQLHYAPQKCIRIINVCCMLHNLLIVNGISDEIN